MKNVLVAALLACGAVVAGTSAGATQGEASTSDTAAPSDDGTSAWPQVKPFLGAAP